MIKNAILIIGTALVCLASFIVYERITSPRSVEEVSATVLLDRVDKVFKLVTVEGNFSEIYNYKNHIIADVWPLRKKAMVQVSARVSVGYDLDAIKIRADESTKTLTIDGALYPSILSIEHDIQGYDFENGLFNVITDQDITKMGTEVKEVIAKKAKESDLFDQSEEQKKELIDMLQWVLKASGWTLKIEPTVTLD